MPVKRLLPTAASLLALTLALTLAPTAQGEIVNVANRGVASSTHTPWGGADISRIIDGDPATYVHADVAPEPPLAYTIDLGKNHTISEVRILPRQDGCCADRLTRIRVSLHLDDGSGAPGTEVWGTDLLTDGSNPGSTAGSVLPIPVTGSPSARHLRIESLASPIPDYALQIADVQILADVPPAEVNRALNAAAAANRPLYGAAPARFLVDGNRMSLVHGLETIENPFFYTINMGTRVTLNEIVLWPRQDGCCPERLSNFRISIHDDLEGAPGPAVWQTTLYGDGSYPDSIAGTREVLGASLDPAGRFEGQWIRIEALDESLQPYTLQIAEIEAFGTTSGGAALLLADQPLDAAAGIGQTTTFTVGASIINGDAAQLAFQWHRNDSPIPGATETSYTTPPLLADDDKARFHCVVSYPGLTPLVSSNATLRLNLAYQARASSNRPLWANGGWNISMLTDGNRTAAIHGDTDIETGMAYELDLGTAVLIEEIVIHPRQDGCCPERLANIRVSILADNAGSPGAEVWKTDLLTDGSNAGSGPGVVVRIPANADPSGTADGQWLRILALDDPPPNYFLQMTEIEVFGAFKNPTPVLEILTQPSAAPSAPGRTGRFTIAAKVVNGDPAAIGYQWFRDGTAIPGATEATYTTPPLAEADTNAVFHCTVSYPGIPDQRSADAKVVFDYNYARGQPAYSNRPLWGPGNWNISAIVDGNRANPVHGDTAPEAGFAYEVDLGTEIAVERIDIYPRQDGCCPERLSDLRVTLHTDASGSIGAERWSAEILTGGENAGSGADIVVSITPDQGTGTPRGNWLRVQAMLDPIPDYFLQLTEIEVIGRTTGPIPVRISSARTANGITLSWPGSGFVLQQTATPAVPASWINVPNATASPVTVPTSSSDQYFRLRSGP
jgi:hypothetical protein